MEFICKLCKSNKLDLILDLGFCPLADSFLTEEQLQKPETYYPLQLYFCNECKLVQLGYIPPLELVFNEEYAYEAGTTQTRREHHYAMAKSICERFVIPKGSLVVDIGSNVGVLLEGFKEKGMQVIGIDASDNVANIARKNGIETITGFFSPSIAKEISIQKKASVITATNVFAHLGDYLDFMKGIDILLAENGIFVFQVHYLLDLIEGLQYDMIFHEHILYESLKPLITFFERIDMDLFDVERLDIDGGVIRCFVSRKGTRKISKNIKKLLEEEDRKGIHSKKRLLEFANDVQQHRENLISLLNDLKKQGNRIVAVSMPAKGVALFNYCKIDTRLVEYATERSSLKINKYSPGSHIQIKSDDMLIKDRPDYAILLAWNFEKEIIKNNQEFLNKGGKFIIPIPQPRIVTR